MSITVRSARNCLVEIDAPLDPSHVTMPLDIPEKRAAAPFEVGACSQRLPRDVLVQLTALSCQVGYLRQGQATHPELSLRLETVAAGLDALIRSIYDETALHYAGRRG